MAHTKAATAAYTQAATATSAHTATAVRRHSRGFRELSAIWAVICREVTVCFKSPGSILMSLLMPVMMMGMIGGNLTQNMAGGLGYDFGLFMMVGMMINMLFMGTSNGVSSLVDDHDSNFSEELLAAPVSRYAIVSGKILGSWIPSVVNMLGTLIVGAFMGITLDIRQLLSILALSPLICFSAGALAMLPIGLIKNRKAANMVSMMITMPQMFLSGAMIPITHTSGILRVISRMMPMTYALDMTRAAVYAGSKAYKQVVIFHPLVSISATVAISVVCVVIGTFFYARSEKNR